MVRIAIAAVAVIAVIAAFTGVMYLRFSHDAIHRSTCTNCGLPVDFPVVVAARDIPAGVTIDADMIELTRLPDAQLDGGAYSETRFVIGQMAIIDIASGEPLTTRKIGRVVYRYRLRRATDYA